MIHLYKHIFLSNFGTLVLEVSPFNGARNHMDVCCVMLFFFSY